MNRIDFSPLYRSTIGFDRFASLLDASLRGDQQDQDYPPYDIEVLEEGRYQITLAVAGYERSELDIQTEKGVLTIAGNKAEREQERQFLHRGIAGRRFERRFNLADHVEVVDARLLNGLLTIELVKEIPEAMKPRTIAIQGADNTLQHDSDSSEAA